MTGDRSPKADVRVDTGEAGQRTSHAPTNTRNVFSIARGSGFLAAGDLFNYVSRTAAAFVLARALGAHEYGLYNIAVSMAFVFSGIADFGLTAAMERFIPVFRKRDDHGGVRGTMQLGVGITLLGAIGFGAAMLFLAPVLAEDMFDDAELELLFRLFSVIVPVLALTNILSAVARGYKRMDYSAFAYDFIQPLVRLVLVVVFVFVRLDAVVATLIFGVSYLAALIVLVRLVRRQAGSAPVAVARRDTKDVTFFSLPFWLTSLMTKIRRNVQSLLLGVFDTATSVGVFSLASSANLVGRTSNLAISTSMRPVLAELFEANDMSEMDRLYKTTTRWTLTLNLPIFVVMVAFPEAILELFGESFVAGATALVILAGSELVNAITGTCGSIVDMSGKGVLKVVNKVVLITLLIGGNLLLIPVLGVAGAALAVLASNAVINLLRVVEIRWFAGIQPYDLRILKPLAAGGVALVAGQALDSWIVASAGPGHLTLDALLTGVVFLVVLLLLGLPEDEKLVLRRLRSRLPHPIRGRDV